MFSEAVLVVCSTRNCNNALFFSLMESPVVSLLLKIFGLSVGAFQTCEICATYNTQNTNTRTVELRRTNISS